MPYQRIEELLALLQPVWQEQPECNLLSLLQQLAQEAGYRGELASLSDDVLIYHLKMRNHEPQTAIPGLQKDYEVDFKAALLRARSITSQ